MLRRKPFLIKVLKFGLILSYEVHEMMSSSLKKSFVRVFFASKNQKN